MLIKGYGHFPAERVAGTHHFVGVPGRVALVARVHPLRAVGQKKVHTRLEPCGLQDRFHDFIGSAGVGRAFQAHQLVAAKPLGDLPSHCFHVLEVGVEVLVKRRGNGDDQDILVTDPVEVCRSRQHARFHQRPQFRSRHIPDVAFAAVHHFDSGRVAVEPDDPEPHLRLLHGKGHPNVAHANDSHFGGLGPETFQQRVPTQ